MANNTYITEAFKALNKMPRMHDSKKSLKESSRRGLTEAGDQSSYEEYKSKVQRAYDNFDASTVTKKDALNGNISTGINHDCADYVGCLAKALDKFGIGYTIYCGVAIPNTDKVDPTDAQQMMKYRNFKPNHCWLVDEYGRKREIPGYSRKVTGDEINIQKNESYKKGLTESEMSPEDEADTEVLRNIQFKMNMRPGSARLNRKELAVLDKYGLYYDKNDAQLRYTESGAPFYGIWNGRTKANLADSARKQQDRQLARRVTDDSVFNARNRYHNMEVALDHRNWARQELDRLDGENRRSYAPNEFNYYQGPQTADSLAKDIDMIKSGREFDRNHAQAQVDRSQKEINKLLRRDESLTESSHTYNGFTVEDEDSHYVIRDFTGNIQSQADTPEEAHQIIDSELGTKQVIVNVNKFSDLDSYCKKFNLSIVNQERAPYMEYTLQGDLNNINALIDIINQYK